MRSAAITSSTVDPGSLADRSRPSALARSAGWSAAAICVGMSGVYAYWAAGGRWATDPAFSPRFSPLLTCGVLCILMIGSAALLLARTGIPIVNVPRPLLRVGPGALAGALAVIGLSNLLAPRATYASNWQVFVFPSVLLILVVLCAIVGGAESGCDEPASTGCV